jgi:hypothetical protein
MPSTVVKSYAERSGKPLGKIEQYWQDAKQEARKKFTRKDSAFWAYVNAIVKRRAGLQEAHGRVTFSQFIAHGEE